MALFTWAERAISAVVQHRLVGIAVAVLETGGHLELVQQGGDVLAAAVDQHHPDAHHAQGGHVLEGGVGWPPPPPGRSRRISPQRSGPRPA